MNRKKQFVIFTSALSDLDLSRVFMELAKSDVSFEYIASKQEIRFTAYNTISIGIEVYSSSFQLYR